MRNRSRGGGWPGKVPAGGRGGKREDTPGKKVTKRGEEDAYMQRIRSRANIEPSSEEEEEEESVERVSWHEKEAGMPVEERGEHVGKGHESETTTSSSTDDSDASSDRDGEGDGRDAQVRSTLKSLPMAERLGLLASGAHGGGRRRQLRVETVQEGNDDEGKEEQPEHSKGHNKHAPKEVSSKKPVSRLRPVFPSGPVGGSQGKAVRRKARDPRFDPALGKVKYEAFRKAYGFLEEYEAREIQTLQTALGKSKGVGTRREQQQTRREGRGREEEVKEALAKLVQRRREREGFERKESVLQERKRAERSKVSAGKEPFYLTKKEKRRLELEDRYERLAKEGRLKAVLEKKRKRNAAKDHRWLPRSRREGGGEGGREGGGEDHRGWM
jgi:ribosomal RNA-processing protein 36